MSGKKQKISTLEKITLVLTALFAVGTVIWTQVSTTGESLTRVVTTHPMQEVLQQELPEAPGMLEGEVLNLNTAAAGDLERLPGIGETKAAAIVTWREERGPFSSVDQLTQVKGIGEATVERIRDYITVTEEPGGEGENYGENSGG